MDEQLRANPDDLVALMRAGRLSPERVAMAAYLGDERALATGVEPWVPPEPPVPHKGPAEIDGEPLLLGGCEEFAGDYERKLSPAGRLLLEGDLRRAERVWLACLLAEHALELRWSGGPEPTKAIRLARAYWAEGKPGTESLREKCRLAASDLPYLTPSIPAAVEAASAAASAAWGLGGERLAAFNASNAAYHAVRAGGPDEIAWQAQAIAAVLLDPEWPPWEE